MRCLFNNVRSSNIFQVRNFGFSSNTNAIVIVIFVYRPFCHCWGWISFFWFNYLWPHALVDASQLCLAVVLVFCLVAKPCKAAGDLISEYLLLHELSTKIKEPHLQSNTVYGNVIPIVKNHNI